MNIKRNRAILILSFFIVISLSTFAIINPRCVDNPFFGVGNHPDFDGPVLQLTVPEYFKDNAAITGTIYDRYDNKPQLFLSFDGGKLFNEFNLTDDNGAPVSFMDETGYRRDIPISFVLTVASVDIGGVPQNVLALKKTVESTSVQYLYRTFDEETNPCLVLSEGGQCHVEALDQTYTMMFKTLDDYDNSVLSTERINLFMAEISATIEEPYFDTDLNNIFTIKAVFEGTEGITGPATLRVIPDDDDIYDTFEEEIVIQRNAVETDYPSQDYIIYGNATIEVTFTDVFGVEHSATKYVYIDQDADKPTVNFYNPYSDTQVVRGTDVYLNGPVIDDDGPVSNVYFQLRYVSESTGEMTYFPGPDENEWEEATLDAGGIWGYIWDSTIARDRQNILSGDDFITLRAYAIDKFGVEGYPAEATFYSNQQPRYVSLATIDGNPADEYEFLRGTMTLAGEYDETEPYEDFDLIIRGGEIETAETGDIRGMVYDKNDLTIDSGTWEFTLDTTAYVDVAGNPIGDGVLIDDQYIIKLQVKYESGQVADNSVVYFIDNKGPELTLTAPSNGLSVNGNVTIRGTITDQENGLGTANPDITNVEIGVIKYALESAPNEHTADFQARDISEYEAVDFYPVDTDSTWETVIDPLDTELPFSGDGTYYLIIKGYDNACTDPMDSSTCNAGYNTHYYDFATDTWEKYSTTSNPYRINVDSDTDKPVVEISTPEENEIKSGIIPLVGTVIDDDGIDNTVYFRIDYEEKTTHDPEVFPTIGDYDLDYNGHYWKALDPSGATWYFNWASDNAEGDCTLHVFAEDTFGTYGNEQTRNFQADQTIPSITILAPPYSANLAGMNRIYGKASSGKPIQEINVSLNGGGWITLTSATPCAHDRNWPPSGDECFDPTNGEWHYDWDMSALSNINTFGAQAVYTDATVESNTQFIVDNDPPTFAVTQPTDGGTVNKTITVYGTANDTGSGLIEVTYCDEDASTADCTTNGHWKATTGSPYNWSISNLDTTLYPEDASQTIFFRVRDQVKYYIEDPGQPNQFIEDSTFLGNIYYETDYDIFVDQDSDDPVVNFIVADGLTPPSYVVSGSAVDDDGIGSVSYVRVYDADTLTVVDSGNTIGTGNWYYAFNGLVEGNYVFEITLRDIYDWETTYLRNPDDPNGWDKIDRRTQPPSYYTVVDPPTEVPTNVDARSFRVVTTGPRFFVEYDSDNTEKNGYVRGDLTVTATLDGSTVETGVTVNVPEIKLINDTTTQYYTMNDLGGGVYDYTITTDAAPWVDGLLILDITASTNVQGTQARNYPSSSQCPANCDPYFESLHIDNTAPEVLLFNQPTDGGTIDADVHIPPVVYDSVLDKYYLPISGTINENLSMYPNTIIDDKIGIKVWDDDASEPGSWEPIPYRLPVEGPDLYCTDSQFKYTFEITPPVSNQLLTHIKIKLTDKAGNVNLLDDDYNPGITFYLDDIPPRLDDPTIEGDPAIFSINGNALDLTQGASARNYWANHLQGDPAGNTVVSGSVYNDITPPYGDGNHRILWQISANSSAPSDANESIPFTSDPDYWNTASLTWTDPADGDFSFNIAAADMAQFAESTTMFFHIAIVDQVTTARTEKTLFIVIDKTDPTGSITKPANDNTAISGTYTISGTAVNPDGINFSDVPTEDMPIHLTITAVSGTFNEVDEVLSCTSDNCSWNYVWEATDAGFETGESGLITLEVIDNAGHTFTASKTINGDNTSPTLTLEYIQDQDAVDIVDVDTGLYNGKYYIRGNLVIAFTFDDTNPVGTTIEWLDARLFDWNPTEVRSSLDDDTLWSSPGVNPLTPLTTPQGIWTFGSALYTDSADDDGSGDYILEFEGTTLYSGPPDIESNEIFSNVANILIDNEDPSIEFDASPVPGGDPGTITWVGDNDTDAFIADPEDADTSIYLDSSNYDEVKGYIQLHSPADEQVSGIILLRGNVYDNLRIRKVELNIGGTGWFETDIDCDPSTPGIDSCQNLDADVYAWQYQWDTRERDPGNIGNIVEDNVLINVRVTDMAGAVDTDSIQVDIVPYITDIYRDDNGGTFTDFTNYSGYLYAERSSYSGAYQIRQGESIIVKGFNICDAASTTATLDGNAITITNKDLTDHNYIRFADTETVNWLWSGELEITVNGIDAINNTNAEGAGGQGYDVWFDQANEEPEPPFGHDWIDDRTIFLWKQLNLDGNGGWADSALCTYPSMDLGVDPSDPTSDKLYLHWISQTQSYDFWAAVDDINKTNPSFDQRRGVEQAADPQYFSYTRLDPYGKSGADDYRAWGIYYNDQFYSGSTRDQNAFHAFKLRPANNYVNRGQKHFFARHLNQWHWLTMDIYATHLTDRTQTRGFVAYYDIYYQDLRYFEFRPTADPSDDGQHQVEVYFNDTGYNQSFENPPWPGWTNPYEGPHPDADPDGLYPSCHNDLDLDLYPDCNNNIYDAADTEYDTEIVDGGLIDNFDDNVGKYAAITYILPGAGASIDQAVPVVVYFDDNDRKIKFAYRDNTEAEFADRWVSRTLASTLSFIGEYNSIAVLDYLESNGIHIATYRSGTGELWYMNLADRNAAATPTVVDSELVVGTWTGIDVDSNNLPHISYLCNSFLATHKGVKYAFKRSDGNWEYMYLPANERIRSERTNVRVMSNGEPVVGYASDTFDILVKLP